MPEENNNEVIDEVAENQKNNSDENIKENKHSVASKKDENSTAKSSENQAELNDEMAALNAEQLISKLKQAQLKADENWDLALRSKAEMDNVRRRTEKDIANARKFGIEKLANELLPVKDSMELGIKAALEVSSDDEAVKKIEEGMEMTLNMMQNAMEKVGIKEVSTSEGDSFNPEFHQAMSMQEVEGKDANTIISVFQKAYSLNDRLLRPAMVIVAK